MTLHLAAPLEPYPDEVSFSIALRTWRRSGLPSATRFIAIAQGTALADADTLFRRVPALVPQLATATSMSSAELFQRHTLVPYWEWASRQPLGENWCGTLLAGAPSERQYFSWCWRQEAGPSFCLDCHEKDVIHLGEPYLRRAHQLPGVLVCQEHQSWLVNSCAKCAWASARSNLEYPRQRCRCGAWLRSVRPAQAGSLRAELEFARWSAQLLAYPMGTRRHPIRDSLRVLAGRAGLVVKNGFPWPTQDEMDAVVSARRSQVLRDAERFLSRVTTNLGAHVLSPMKEYQRARMPHPVEVLLCVKALAGDSDPVEDILSTQAELSARSPWQERWLAIGPRETPKRHELLLQLVEECAPSFVGWNVEELETHLGAQLGITQKAFERHRRLSAALDARLRELRKDLFSTGKPRRPRKT